MKFMRMIRTDWTHEDLAVREQTTISKEHGAFAASYRRAIECTATEAERAFLRGRLAELRDLTS